MIDQTNPLPETDLKATVKFPARGMALDFARDWTRYTLMGHSIKGNTVEVYNVTDESRVWIDSYVARLSESYGV